MQHQQPGQRAASLRRQSALTARFFPMSSDCLDDYHAAPPSPLLALVGMPHLHGALQAAAAAAEPKPRVLSFASLHNFASFQRRGWPERVHDA